jgi:hypothetical protein
VVAQSAAEELVAGRLITTEQAEFAQRIIHQQIEIMLLSDCRPIGD